MRPVSKFVFKRTPEDKTRYVLVEHIGDSIDGFPCIYDAEKNEDTQYIIYRFTYIENQQKFIHFIELSDGRIFTELFFSIMEPNKTFGDDQSIGLNDSILIEFSDNGKVMTFLFYKDMANVSTELYEKWIAGQLETTVECNVLKILVDQKSGYLK